MKVGHALGTALVALALIGCGSDESRDDESESTDTGALCGPDGIPCCTELVNQTGDINPQLRAPRFELDTPEGMSVDVWQDPEQLFQLESTTTEPGEFGYVHHLQLNSEDADEGGAIRLVIELPTEHVAWPDTGGTIRFVDGYPLEIRTGDDSLLVALSLFDQRSSEILGIAVRPASAPTCRGVGDDLPGFWQAVEVFDLVFSLPGGESLSLAHAESAEIEVDGARYAVHATGVVAGCCTENPAVGIDALRYRIARIAD